MRNYLNSKKAFSLPSENSIVIISIIFFVLYLFFLYFFGGSAKEVYETSFKDIQYAFPKSVVVGFLNMPLTKETKEKLGFDVSDNSLRVLDLMKLDGEEYSTEIEKYRKDYIDFIGKDDIVLFEKFSNSKLGYDYFKVSSTYGSFKNLNDRLESSIEGLKKDEFFVLIPCISSIRDLIKRDVKDKENNYEVCFREVRFN